MQRPVSSSGRPLAFRLDGELDPEGCKGGRFWIEASTTVTIRAVIGSIPEYFTRFTLGWSMTSSTSSIITVFDDLD